MNHDPLQFQGYRALQDVKALALKFPNRVTWSESRQKAAEHLKGRFKELGYEPKGMLFSEIIGGKKISGLENIYAEKIGKKHPDQIIAVVAHYDAPEGSTEAAMDDASGVGVVLELARIFSKVETDRSMLFLLTDSEEYGAFWGAHTFVREYEKRNQIIAALNFDFVNLFEMEGILNLNDGLKEGYTPLWLREMALESIRSLKQVEARDFRNIMEHIQRAILIPPSDHGEFLAQGIPSFNWLGQNKDFAKLMREYHHTEKDKLEFLQPRSLDIYGKAAERLMRSINQMTSLPSDFRESNYWKIGTNLYIPGVAVFILHILAMIPFLTVAMLRIVEVFSRTDRKVVKNVILNELKNCAVLVGAMGFGYVILMLLPYLRIIDQYELYPATQKSYLLYHPNYIAIIGVFTAIGGALYILGKVFSTKHDALGHPEARQAVHGVLLAIVIFLAFCKNSYLATLMLMPPAYLWLAIRVRKQIQGRIINGLLIFSGAITLVAMSLVMSQVFHLGVFYWYVFLGAAYGLFSVYTIILVIIIIAIMFRLARGFVLRKT
ncbi:MAG: M28 family peptidase [Xanthomonadaceae bacterium]|nr:M28 family peptidase [Xanthomonadaceae bacterium]